MKRVKEKEKEWRGGIKERIGKIKKMYKNIGKGIYI